MPPVLLLCALIAAGCSSPKAQTASAPPDVPVSVAVASQERVPLEIRAVGNVEPFSTVQIKSQVSGEITAVRFVEGGQVRQGDLLFEIDSRPYREALRQAEAALAKDSAQLRQSEANLARDRAQLKNAEADAARYEELAKEGVAARMQSEQLRTTADVLRESIRADQAAIESARASLDSDRAAIDRAKLDLAYCQIRSPIAGRAGTLLVHAGNLVKANGDSPLVVINRIAPIFVTFAIPERHLPAVRQRSASRKLPVAAFPANAPGRVAHGLLTAIDNTVDPSTGAIRLKAAFDNAERLLWPGEFVNVVVTLDTRTATVVPSEAVQAGQREPFLYVVRADRTVESRNVAVGLAAGRKVVIEKGVSPGETVVTDGQLRLFPGARVQPVAADKVDSQPL